MSVEEDEILPEFSTPPETEFSTPPETLPEGSPHEASPLCETLPEAFNSPEAPPESSVSPVIPPEAAPLPGAPSQLSTLPAPLPESSSSPATPSPPGEALRNLICPMSETDVRRVENPVLEPFVMPCPASQCDTTTLLEWHCHRCCQRIQLNNEVLLCCSCGAVEKTKSAFKCASASHGNDFCSICAESNGPAENREPDSQEESKDSNGEESEKSDGEESEKSGCSPHMCQECERYGEEVQADFVCSDCRDFYYCLDCLESVHKRPKLRSHKYQKLGDAVRSGTRECVLNVKDAEFVKKLPHSDLPWKSSVPGLFQLLKVVFDDTDSSVFEKVVIVEDELSNLCNTFVPNCCSSDCSKIDFDVLKQCSVVPIGLAGDNRAVYDFLCSHLGVDSSIDYEKMADPKFCPSGLYGLMPNKTSLFMFYWRSGSYSPELENTSITCQMLRHVRDYCSEIILFFDEKTFMNLKLTRPEKKDHLSHQDVIIKCEMTEHSAKPLKGFVVHFEGTPKNVVLSDNMSRFYFCIPYFCPRFIRAWTGEKHFLDLPSELLALFNDFNDYKVIWKAKKREELNIDSVIRPFLQIAFPDIERKLENLDQELKKAKRDHEEDCNKLADVCKDERHFVEQFWKKKLFAFLSKNFSMEENFDPLLTHATGEDISDYEKTADTMFLACQEEILRDFQRLRKKTLIIEKVRSETSTILEKKAVTKFYNFCVTSAQALTEFQSEQKSWWSKHTSKLKNAFMNLVGAGVFDLSENFVLPEEEKLREYHLKYYRILRGNWVGKCPFNAQTRLEELRKTLPSLKAKVKDFNRKRQQIVRKTESGWELGGGRLTVNVFEFKHSGQGRVFMRYDREYFEKDKVEYQVRKLEVTSDQVTEAGSDENYSFHPLLTDLQGAVFNLVKDEQEVRALYSIPDSNKIILVVYSKPVGKGETGQSTRSLLQTTDQLATAPGSILVYVEQWDRLTKSKPLRAVTQKDIHRIAFDADKRLLAFWDNDEKVLAVYEFTDYYLSLRPSSEHPLKDNYYEVDILHMQFINGKKEILLVDSNLLGSVYDIRKAKSYPARLHFKKEGEQLISVFTYNDFALTVSLQGVSSAVEKDGRATEEKKEEPFSAKFNFCVRAYSCEAFRPVCGEEIHVFTEASRCARFRLVQFQSQLHLVCVDGSGGKCQSVRLKLVSPGSSLNVVSSRSSKSDVDLKMNQVFEQFHTIFRKYAITHCYEAKAKPLQITFRIPVTVKPRLSLEEFQESMLSYFHSMLNALQVETGKSVKPLLKTMRLQACRSDDLSAVFSYPYEAVPANEFVLSIATSVPIQVARAENNVLRPLSKGVNVTFPGALNSVADFVDAISFGVYEAIFNYSAKPAKVISAKGRQSAGKSFLLNHVTGAQFDIAGGRCTQGIWMSVRLYPEVTIIALDFEGLGSFERSRQEDMLMAVFGGAISSLTIFKTGPRFDEDTKRMFDRFQDGATYLKQSDTENQLFKGKLAVICKDVSSGDSNSVREEMVKKILEVLRTDMENNFVKNLYGGEFRVATSENFGKREFFQSFDDIRKHFDTQESLGSAKDTAELMKIVLAKIYLQDWTALDKTRINKVLNLLKQNVEDAVWCGSLFDGTERRPLGKFESDKEVVEDTELPESLAKNDLGFVLYASEKNARSKLREHVLKDYFALNKTDAIGTAEFCSSFKKQLTALVERRIARVEEWISLNTKVFKEDSDVTSLLLDTKLNCFSPLRQFWTICEQKCQRCDRLCLKQSRHNEEKGDQGHDCHTSHRCEYECSYSRDSSEKGIACGFSCGHCGGHTGKHQCKENKHTCDIACELSAYRGCNGTCSRKVDHVKAEDERSRLHRCDAEIHCCNKKCDLPDCKNYCALPYDHKGRHQCTIDYCPKSCCMKSCSNRCGSSDHFHSLDESAIHICIHKHDCREDCEKHGYCAIESTFSGVKTERFEGRYGEFEYVMQARQIPRRKPCVIPIPPGETRHEGDHCHYSPEGTHEIHFCTATCPTCENICTKEFGHEGLHNTNHSNMVNQVFVSQSAEITVGERKYGRGESARAEMCNQFCKRLGRGHTHVVRCPGNHEADPRLKHDVTHLGTDRSVVLDEVTHEYYWEKCGFEDNCTDAERELYQKCDRVCDAVETTPDFGSDNDAFCQLQLWHEPLSSQQRVSKGHVSSGGHHFHCQHEKQTGYHVVLAIDKSGSMSGKDQQPGTSSGLKGGSLDNRLGAVLEMCDAFCRKRSSASSIDALSVISFNHDASTHWVGEPMSPGISDTFLERSVFPSGSTSFFPALKEARNAIVSFAKQKADNNEIIPVVIMLSDGGCGDGKEAIDEAFLLKSNYPTSTSPLLFSIRFGSDASGEEVLRKISSNNQVSRSETAIQLDAVLRVFHEKMLRGTIGVLEKVS